MRQHFSLAGSWQFQVDPGGTLSVDTLAPDRQIPVPMPWQAAFPDLKEYDGYAWYRTTVTIAPDWLGGQVVLTFGAVDYWCQVFVNRTLLAEHEGGYTPFSVNITAALRPGDNEITVRVYDPVQRAITLRRWSDQPRAQQLPFDAEQIPHGKQEWYINVGGIWQDVTLDVLPATYIAQVHLTPDIHSGQVQAVITLGGSLDTDGVLSLEIDSVAMSVPLTRHQDSYTLAVRVRQPKLWDMESPNLYTASVRLQLASGDDEKRVRFGFREITTRDGQLLLNGQAIYLRSALDQDFYPDTIYTVPSEEFLRDQFVKAKQLGLNNLRCHIKPPDPRYLDLADEMGLLVWAEIPSWRTFHQRLTVRPQSLMLDDAIKTRVSDTLEAMIRRDYNHPSLIIWTIVNEDWGTSLPLSADDRAWVSGMYDLCKRLDPTRLVVDNSPCPGPWGANIHVKSDLDDFHLYANIPDKANDYVTFVEQFDLRPIWTYSAHGDSVRTGKEPLILSEFGNWSLPSLRALRSGGSDPIWFKDGAWWSSWDGEPSYAAGVEERFEKLGLNAIWPDYEAFAQASQWHQFQALKFEIETMRRLSNIRGYVITEFTDIYWESNGLLDFRRGPKAYHDRFGQFNADDVIVAQPDGYASWDDRSRQVTFYASHYSAADWGGARLIWRCGDQESQIAVPNVERSQVVNLGAHQLTFPAVTQAQTMALTMRLIGREGNVLAENVTELLILPARDRIARYEGALAVMLRSSASAAHAIRQIGYQVEGHLDAETKVIVTDYPDAQMLDWVRQGGDMLYFATGTGPFFWRQGRGGVYSGNWITSFSWLRSGAYRRLGNAPIPASMPFQHVAPDGVILGIPVEDKAFQQDFLAGQVTGWIQHPALHTVAFRYGEGRVVMTTCTLEKALARSDEPVAVAMLHDLIDHLTTCDPILRANY